MKSRTHWLAAIVAACVMLCGCVQVANAADLPSDLTGTYAGSGSLAGWTCEIRAYAIQPSGLQSHVLSVDCATPGGRSGGNVAIWDQCPTSETTVPLAGAAGVTPSTPRMAVLSYSPAGCALGSVSVSIAGGAPATMCRTQIIVPTFPYPGCGAPEVQPQPPKHYPRLCRQFGLFCGS